MPPAEEATHYSLLNGRRPRASPSRWPPQPAAAATLRGRSAMRPDSPKRPLRGAFKSIRVLQADTLGDALGTQSHASDCRAFSATSPKRPGTPRGPKTLSRAKPGQIRLRPRSVCETWTDKATSPKRPHPKRPRSVPRSVRGPPRLNRASISAQTRRAGPTPRTQKGRRPGMRATAWGREGGGPGRPPPQGKGPAPGA